MSNYFIRISMGIGSTILENDSERKSISTERTFQDISNPEMMYMKCEEICEALAADAVRAGVQGYTVTLKIKLATFELHTRSKTLLHPISSKSEVFPIVADLLRQELSSKKNMSLRLIGVGLSKLTRGDNGGQKQKSLEYFLNKSNQKMQILPENKNSPRCEMNNENPIRSHINMDERTPQTLSRNLNEEQSVWNKDLEQVEANFPKLPQSMTLMPKELQSGSKLMTGEDQFCLKLTPVLESTSRNRNRNETTSGLSLSEHDDVALSTSEILLQPDEQTSYHIVDMQGQKNSNTANVVGNSFSMADEVENLTCMTCPVCNATFCAQDITLTKFNDHLDSCLNRKTIREIVKSESKLYPSQTASTSRKRKKNLKSPVAKKNNIPSGTIDMYLTK